MYDRVLEDRALLAALKPGASGPNDRLIPAQAASFVSRNLRLALGGGRDCRPYAGVNFGDLISARRYASSRGLDFRALDDEARAGQVKLLTEELMRAVRELVPVLPVPVVAHTLVNSSGEELTGSEIKARARTLTSNLQARVYLPGDERDIEAGLDLLIARRLVAKEDDLYRISPRGIELLRYYAASISHLVDVGWEARVTPDGGSAEAGRV